MSRFHRALLWLMILQGVLGVAFLAAPDRVLDATRIIAPVEVNVVVRVVGAFVVAGKIRQGAEELAGTLTREEAPTTVSVGLVSHPEDGSTDEELMLAVDRAMYVAKSGGKNQVSGYPRPAKPSAQSKTAITQASALG